MQPTSRVAKKDLSRFLQQQPNVLLAKILPLAVYHRYLALIGFYYFGVNAPERRNLLKSLRYVLGGRLVNGKSVSFGYLRPAPGSAHTTPRR